MLELLALESVRVLVKSHPSQSKSTGLRNTSTQTSREAGNLPGNGFCPEQKHGANEADSEEEASPLSLYSLVQSYRLALAQKPQVGDTIKSNS